MREVLLKNEINIYTIFIQDLCILVKVFFQNALPKQIFSRIPWTEKHKKTGEYLGELPKTPLTEVWKYGILTTDMIEI